jgi:hypothetical protein
MRAKKQKAYPNDSDEPASHAANASDSNVESIYGSAPNFDETHDDNDGGVDNGNDNDQHNPSSIYASAPQALVNDTAANCNFTEFRETRSKLIVVRFCCCFRFKSRSSCLWYTWSSTGCL